MQAVAESEVDNSVLSTKWDGGFGPVRCQWKQASADSARKDQGDHIIHDALNLEMNTAFRWQSLVCSDDDLKPAVHGGPSCIYPTANDVPDFSAEFDIVVATCSYSGHLHLFRSGHRPARDRSAA